MTGYDPPRGRDRIRPDTLLPPALRPGSEAWRWAAVCVRSMRVAAEVGLAVMATGLIGTGIALGLDGLGALRLNIPQPESEALAVGLAAAMIGSALLGVAVEGAFRSPTLRPDAAPWEILVSYIPGLAVTLAITELLESWAARLLPRFSDLFELVPSYLDTVGNRGVIAGLAGLALMWPALQYGAPRYRFVGENAPALLYLCWMAAVIAAYPPSGP